MSFATANWRWALAIRHEASTERRYNVMEFCGGHTHAIFRYGVQDLELAEQHGVILCSYGGMLRVPASKRRSLLKAKAGGADVRMVYSVDDALKIARRNPGREVVFFAIGFETTTPPTAVARPWSSGLRVSTASERLPLLRPAQ